MARLDPSSAQDFADQKNRWLSEALEHLPIAIGLVDAEGNFLALMGSLRHLFGPVIPTREPIRHWQALDKSGKPCGPTNCPFERTLREGLAVNGVEAVYRAGTDQERRARLYSAPFVDASGKSAALVFVHDVAWEREAQAHKFELMQQRFVDTLVGTIRQLAEGGEGAGEAQTKIAQTMGFTGINRATKTPDILSPREEEVLRLMAWGNSRKQIGAQLGIAVKTVEFHRSSAARKLDLKSRVDVVRYAIERGWMNVGG